MSIWYGDAIIVSYAFRKIAMSKFLSVILGVLAGALGYHLYIKEGYSGPRIAEYPVEKMVISRWSPRSFTGDILSQKQLMSVFEAARWAPSAYNVQPWRFVFALKDTDGWKAIFNTLFPGNQIWAKDASAFIVALSLLSHEGKDFETHSLDVGAATQNMALQAQAMGLAMHAMGGFEKAALRKALLVPDEYAIEAVYAIGKQAPKDKLPLALQKNEMPSDRKPLSELVYENSFGQKVQV